MYEGVGSSNFLPGDRGDLISRGGDFMSREGDFMSREGDLISRRGDAISDPPVGTGKGGGT
jgi:hypothetical protein